MPLSSRLRDNEFPRFVGADREGIGAVEEGGSGYPCENGPESPMSIRMLDNAEYRVVGISSGVSRGGVGRESLLMAVSLVDPEDQEGVVIRVLDGSIVMEFEDGRVLSFDAVEFRAAVAS